MIVRKAEGRDIDDMRDLLNEIISIGGSTALEQSVTSVEIDAAYLTGPNHVCCFVAVDSDNSIVGFQALERKEGAPADIAYSSTFARQTDPVPGTGTALFEATKSEAARIGISEIIAKIRADNVSGLAYYSKMGFEDFKVDRDVPLKDGTPVDRISKRFVLAKAQQS